MKDAAVTLAQNETRQRKCYGMTVAEMSADLKVQARIVGWRMLAMSILSDAQEVARLGEPEAARQYINKAKWIIANHWTKEEAR